MRQSSCLKMMKQTAEDDRCILRFPMPACSHATPYKETDFNEEVKDLCLSNRSIKIGLKISKAIIVGDVAVGKTCLVNRFCHEVFERDYKATIGVDFEVERFDILHSPFNLQIWDTAGQERFKCIASSYYRGAHVVVIVFDISNLMSLHNAPKWKDDALENNFGDPHIFLVGTKKDLCSQAAYHAVEEQAIKLAKLMKAEYWAVSSMTGENVKEFFFRLSALTFNSRILNETKGNMQKVSVGNDLITENRFSQVKDLELDMVFENEEWSSSDDDEFS
ncbi:Ras-related protein Rab-34 [Nymphon striatum]|nr:Ras-related protein Rab-34 [Nymphon striatum]